jgi:hypothetical protein
MPTGLRQIMTSSPSFVIIVVIITVFMMPGVESIDGQPVYNRESARKEQDINLQA